MDLDRESILGRLGKVPYPGFTRDIVRSGVVAEVRVEEDHVAIRLQLPPQSAAVEGTIRDGIRAALAPEIPPERIRFAAGAGSAALNVVGQRPSAARAGSAQSDLIPGVRHVVAVASGKGGVGKSTVAVNLALALARAGHRVGLLDADVYGPSIPLMMGVSGQKPRLDASGKRLVPFERFGVRFMSLGALVDPESAVIWRGPMVMKALEQLLGDVVWGELDYLVLDLPPGTGDAQLTVSQRLQLAGAVIVSTPQDVALADAVKGVAMFRKVHVPILGVVENMSVFRCPHCGERSEVFGHGGARERAAALDVPFLGELPLDPLFRTSGDEGTPLVAQAPDSENGRRFAEIAAAIERALRGAGGDDTQPGLLQSAARKLGWKGKRD